MIFLLIAVLLLSACAAPIKDLYPPQFCDQVKTIYVVSHGWHTGIVIDASDLQGYLAEVKQDFEEARYLEIGWGDRGFYQANEITSGLTLHAIFWPTDSILHIVGLFELPAIAFPASEVLAIQLSDKGYENLLKYLDNTFRRTDGQVLRLKNGLYGWSRFYDANGKYHLFKTCNNWVASGVRQSGFPISTFYAASAGNVMYQLKRYAFPPLNCTH